MQLTGFFQLLNILINFILHYRRIKISFFYIEIYMKLIKLIKRRVIQKKANLEEDR